MPKAWFSVDGDLGEIVIADPPLTLFGEELLRDLAAAEEQAKNSKVRAIVVRAEGENFSAGANAELFLERDEEAAQALLEEFLPTIRGFTEIKVPTIAAVQGL